MDREIRELMEELGRAINESIAESGRVGAIIGEMELAGYDVVVALETTIGLSTRDERTEVASWKSETPLRPALTAPGDMDLTPQDHKFLEMLKIAT